MRIRHLASALLVLLLCAVLPAPSLADRCPTCHGTGAVTCSACGGTGISAYITIHGQQAAYGCERCGGVRGDPMRGTGRQGSGRITCPTCGGTGRAEQSQSSTDNQAPATRGADERRREEEDRQRRADEVREQKEEDARRRQEDFDKAKSDALRSMKGITENELGLKGAGSGDDPGLKGAGDSGTSDLGLKGSGVTHPRSFADSSVVDLRSLVNPGKPIIVDPNVPKGRDRRFPVQVDPATLTNAAYNQGFKHLALPGVTEAIAAVEDFNRALQERPRDPLVHNGLLLAQDILRRRQQVEQDNGAKAAHWTVQAYAALMSGELGSALAFITRAQDLSPDNGQIRALASLTEQIANQTSLSRALDERAAYLLVGSSLVSLGSDNVSAAAGMLEAAKGLAPKDPFIASMLSAVRSHEAGDVSKTPAGKQP